MVDSEEGGDGGRGGGGGDIHQQVLVVPGKREGDRCRKAAAAVTVHTAYEVFPPLFKEIIGTMR